MRPSSATARPACTRSCATRSGQQPAPADQRAELRALQDLRHQGPDAEHQLGRARRRRRPELPEHVILRDALPPCIRESEPTRCACHWLRFALLLAALLCLGTRRLRPTTAAQGRALAAPERRHPARPQRGLGPAGQRHALRAAAQRHAEGSRQPAHAGVGRLADGARRPARARALARAHGVQGLARTCRPATWCSTSSGWAWPSAPTPTRARASSRPCIKLELPSNTADLLDRSLLVLREKADQLLIPAAELDKERGVVLSEKRLRDTAQYRAYDRRPGFPAARHARYRSAGPSAWKTVVSTAPRERLLEFYRALLHALAHDARSRWARSIPRSFAALHPQALRQLPRSAARRRSNPELGQRARRAAWRRACTTRRRDARPCRLAVAKPYQAGARYARTAGARAQSVPRRRDDLAPARHAGAEARRRLPGRCCPERRLSRASPRSGSSCSTPSPISGARRSASRRQSCGAR